MKSRKVVLTAQGGIVLTGELPFRDAIRRRRTGVRRVMARSLHAGLAVLHQIDLEWHYDRLLQQVSLPTYQELRGEEIEVLSASWMNGVFDDVVNATDAEGFTYADKGQARKMTYHFITPLGSAALTLQCHWTGGDTFFVDLSPSESA